MSEPEGGRRPLEIDEGFLGRVYRTSLWAGGLAALAVWAGPGAGAAVSFGAGGAVSLGMLRLLEYTVRILLTPGRSPQRASRAFLAAALGKYFLVAVGFYFLLQSPWARPGWLAAGVGLTQAVIALKAFGILLVNWMNRE